MLLLTERILLLVSWHVQLPASRLRFYCVSLNTKNAPLGDEPGGALCLIFLVKQLWFAKTPAYREINNIVAVISPPSCHES